MTRNADEDRILRVWTPILLRTILIAAVIVLLGGLVFTYTYAPNYYVQRYHAVQQGHLLGKEKFDGLLGRILTGQPHAMLMTGLFVLTLVPLVRVGFCFLFFIKERDYQYVIFTAYVLLGLIVGVVLGRVG
jgi:uncharacterized membrane protein